MKKPISINKHRAKVDAVFSRWIRNRDEGVCFTCGLKREPKAMQNGHYVSRQFNATRFDERNCNTQCYACNMFYGGRPATYTLKLQEKYGEGIIKELHDLGKTSKQFSHEELDSIIEKYADRNIY